MNGKDPRKGKQCHRTPLSSFTWCNPCAKTLIEAGARVSVLGKIFTTLVGQFECFQSLRLKFPDKIFDTYRKLNKPEMKSEGMIFLASSWLSKFPCSRDRRDLGQCGICHSSSMHIRHLIIQTHGEVSDDLQREVGEKTTNCKTELQRNGCFFRRLPSFGLAGMMHVK